MHKLVLALSLATGLVAQETGPGKAPPPPTSAAPKKFAAPPTLTVPDATAAALAALLRLPEGDDHDQWPYEGVYREDRGQLPVGYRVGGTAIVCLSLIAAPGVAADEPRRAALHKGLDFVLRTLDAERMSDGFLGTYDVRGWGHIYALELLLHLADHDLVPADRREQVAAKTQWLVATLAGSAIPTRGGWNYSRRAGYKSPDNRASTFMTPVALQALFHAKARGYAVDDAVVTQALDALDRARSAPGGYAYGSPADSQNDVGEAQLSMMDTIPSSAARAAVCEATLLLAGRGDQDRLRRAIERFFTYWDDLAVRKSKTGTHIPPYGIAPYFFLYGHTYTAQAIELLPDGPDKDRLRASMLVVLARSRDDDGSWNDRQFDRSAGYGTAMAILAMQMPHLPKPAEWRPSAAGASSVGK